MSNQNCISSDYGETKTLGFSQLDFKSTYSFNDRIQMIVGVRNITDQAYYEYLNRSAKGSQ